MKKFQLAAFICLLPTIWAIENSHIIMSVTFLALSVLFLIISHIKSAKFRTI